MQPILLTDKSRLQEIYDLRVLAWEQSEHGYLINKESFPKGWSDELDPFSYHWIVLNKEERIIAAARLCIIDKEEDFEFNKYFKKIGFRFSTPFAYYSRLIVHLQYRGEGIARKIDNSRILFINEKRIPLTVGVFHNNRLTSLKNYGFENLGKYELYYNKRLEKFNLLYLQLNKILLPKDLDLTNKEVATV